MSIVPFPGYCEAVGRTGFGEEKEKMKKKKPTVAGSLPCVFEGDWGKQSVTIGVKIHMQIPRSK